MGRQGVGGCIQILGLNGVSINILTYEPFILKLVRLQQQKCGSAVQLAKNNDVFNTWHIGQRFCPVARVFWVGGNVVDGG